MSEVDHKLYLAGIPEGLTFTVTEVSTHASSKFDSQVVFKCANGDLADYPEEYVYEVSPQQEEGWIGTSVLCSKLGPEDRSWRQRGRIEMKFKITGKHRTAKGEETDLDSNQITGRIVIGSACVGESTASIVTYGLDGATPTTVVIDINGTDQDPPEGVYAPSFYFVFAIGIDREVRILALDSVIKQGAGAIELALMIEEMGGNYKEPRGFSERFGASIIRL